MPLIFQDTLIASNASGLYTLRSRTHGSNGSWTDITTINGPSNGIVNIGTAGYTSLPLDSNVFQTGGWYDFMWEDGNGLQSNVRTLLIPTDATLSFMYLALEDAGTKVRLVAGANHVSTTDQVHLQCLDTNGQWQNIAVMFMNSVGIIDALLLLAEMHLPGTSPYTLRLQQNGSSGLVATSEQRSLQLDGQAMVNTTDYGYGNGAIAIGGGSFEVIELMLQFGYPVYANTTGTKIYNQSSASYIFEQQEADGTWRALETINSWQVGNYSVELPSRGVDLSKPGTFRLRNNASTAISNSVTLEFY